MGRKIKTQKPRGNRSNIIKNTKRIQNNFEVLKELKNS